jgi:hypothetical protein
MGVASRLGVTIVVVTGCYRPDVRDGIPCSDHGACPEGQICSDDVCQLASSFVWDPPTVLHELDDPEGAQDPCTTEDRLTIVWSSTRDGGAGSDDLWIATRATTAEPYGDITNLSALNNDSSDTTPEISADGSTIYFTSDRAGDDDIWMSTKDLDGTWAAPTRVDELSRHGSDESEVALTPDGLIVVLVRDNEFYQATRESPGDRFGGLTAIPELDIGGEASSPTIGDHAGVVYFHSGEPRELFVSRLLPDGTYSAPEPVHELDTDDRNADPFITGDERHMVFNRGDAIYETQRD